MAKKTRLDELKADLKNKEAKSLYLFYGEEAYGKKLYFDKLCDLIDDGGFPDFNRIVLDGKKNIEEYDEAIESFPMMCDKKLVTIRDSGLFTKATEEEKRYFTKRFQDIPDYLTLVFDEKEVDKRSALYKALAKAGVDIEFNFIDKTELVTWVMRCVLKEQKKMSKDVCEYFVSICDDGMQNVKNELDKLFAYCDETITKTDVEKVVSKAVGVKVFELTDCIMSKDIDGCLNILNDLKTVKEPAYRILYLLGQTFDKMLHSLLLVSEGENYQDIAKKLSLAPFIAKKYINSSRSFGENYLTDRVMKVAEIDYAIKSGEVGDWEALEYYVIESCQMII